MEQTLEGASNLLIGPFDTQTGENASPQLTQQHCLCKTLHAVVLRGPNDVNVNERKGKGQLCSLPTPGHPTQPVRLLEEILSTPLQ